MRRGADERVVEDADEQGEPERGDDRTCDVLQSHEVDDDEHRDHQEDEGVDQQVRCADRSVDHEVVREERQVADHGDYYPQYHRRHQAALAALSERHHVLLAEDQQDVVEDHDLQCEDDHADELGEEAVEDPDAQRDEHVEHEDRGERQELEQPVVLVHEDAGLGQPRVPSLRCWRAPRGGGGRRRASR